MIPQTFNYIIRTTQTIYINHHNHEHTHERDRVSKLSVDSTLGASFFDKINSQEPLINKIQSNMLTSNFRIVQNHSKNIKHHNHK
jgi:hypothetical protein